MADKVQSYANHAQIVPMYHYVTLGILQLTFIGACVNLYQSWGDHARFYSASLLVTLTFATILLALYARFFALKAQDRAIRAEEQLRHYVMTGKLLDPTPRRSVRSSGFASRRTRSSLRWHSALPIRTCPAKDIKQAVRNWRADTDRVVVVELQRLASRFVFRFGSGSIHFRSQTFISNLGFPRCTSPVRTSPPPS